MGRTECASREGGKVTKTSIRSLMISGQIGCDAKMPSQKLVSNFLTASAKLLKDCPPGSVFS